ncbi:MAG: hypothetical protein JSS82_18600 [Bacteroidetes bacterium]|nr:hypothetical protein [Bacteroidota bacterium]
MRSALATILLICVYANTYAQDTSVFKYPIQMDDVVVTATRSGWDLQGFIRRVQSDTTFYKAFRSLHIVPFSAVNDIKVYDKGGKIRASLYSKTKQNVTNGCRTMQVLEEKTTGDFYNRRRQYNYYTAELYAYLFFTVGKVCGEDNVVAGMLNVRGKGQMEKSKAQLKQLMFNPGAHIQGVPFMGDKAAMFDPDVAKRYDFKLTSENYANEECYVFRAVPKKGEEKNVVYDDFATWFRKSDYAIVARDYSLSYNTIAYDFDVKMKVRLGQHGKYLLPERIDYNGNWYVFTKGRERVRFTAVFSY